MKKDIRLLKMPTPPAISYISGPIHITSVVYYNRIYSIVSDSVQVVAFYVIV